MRESLSSFLVYDGVRATFAEEKPGTGSRDGYSRKTSIVEYLERKCGFK